MAAIRPMWIVRFEGAAPEGVQAIGIFDSEENAKAYMARYMADQPSETFTWHTLEVRPILGAERRSQTAWHSQV